MNRRDFIKSTAVTSYFHYGLAESARKNPFTTAGGVTSLTLGPDRPLSVNYIMAVAPIPKGFDRVAQILPGIATLGIDVLDVDHMVNLCAVRAAVGPKTVIGGNIDPVAAGMRSNPDAIRVTMISCYEQAGNPFMVKAGCEIPSATPAENLRVLCKPIPYRRF